MNEILKATIGSFIRSLVTVAGAVLVTKGIASSETVGTMANGAAEIGVGVATYLLALALSYKSNRKKQKKVEAVAKKAVELAPHLEGKL